MSTAVKMDYYLHTKRIFLNLKKYRNRKIKCDELQKYIGNKHLTLMKFRCTKKWVAWYSKYQYKIYKFEYFCYTCIKFLLIRWPFETSRKFAQGILILVKKFD